MLFFFSSRIESFLLLREETEIVSCLADGNAGKEWMRLLQHTLCNVFVAKAPDQTPRLRWVSRGIEGPYQSCLCGEPWYWPWGQQWPQHCGGGPEQGELAPFGVGAVVPSGWAPRGKGDKGLSSPVNPPSQGSVGGNELFSGPIWVEEAAPVLPWLYLGQAAAGTALKCEAASLGIAGGKK